MTIEETTQRPHEPTAGDHLVEVRDIKMYFPVTSGIIFQRKVADVKAVDGVSFDIRKGETLGLVGESRLRQDDPGPGHPAAVQADGWARSCSTART